MPYPLMSKESEEIKSDSPTGTTTKWGCSRECKPLTPQEVDTIVGFKEASHA